MFLRGSWLIHSCAEGYIPRPPARYARLRMNHKHPLADSDNLIQLVAPNTKPFQLSNLLLTQRPCQMVSLTHNVHDNIRLAHENGYVKGLKIVLPIPIWCIAGHNQLWVPTEAYLLARHTTVSFDKVLNYLLRTCTEPITFVISSLADIACDLFDHSTIPPLWEALAPWFGHMFASPESSRPFSVRTIMGKPCNDSPFNSR